ncbi:hypothetical protein NKH77_21865 [Streptomyces sp. M19]
MARAGHLFGAIRSEFLCAARDLRTWAQPEARAAVVRQMREADRPRPAIRKLLSPVALAEEEARAELRQVQGEGATSGSARRHCRTRRSSSTGR